MYPYGADLDTDAYAGRIKTALTLPPIKLRANVAVCLGFVPNYPCPLKLKLPREDPDVSISGYYGIAGQAYVQSPPGVKPEYGVFPPVRVHTLAFGSVPVSATVQITQPLSSQGFATPIQLSWFTSATNIKPGARIPGYEQYGPAPRDDSVNILWSPPPDLSGRVAVKVSDLRLDGRRVNVGSRCASLSTLKLTSRGGFYASSGKTPGNGQPGEYSPLAPEGNSYLHGVLDIPRFQNCGTSTENLSPLISSFVSGDKTLINVTQIGPLGPFCTKYPADRTCKSPSGSASIALTKRQFSSIPLNARERLRRLVRLTGQGGKAAPAHS